MPRISKVQNSFTTGEITPEAYARTDADQYNAATSYCSNFLVSPRGPLTRRPPTKLFNFVWDHTKTYRLVPFRLGPSLQVICVFSSAGTVRFIKNGAWVGAPYEVTLPAAWQSAAVIESFSYFQSNDVLFLAPAATIPPATLIRASDTSWTYTALMDSLGSPAAASSLYDGPYNPINSVAANTHTLSGISGSVTITAAQASFNTTLDLGRLYRIRGATGTGAAASDWIWGTITAVASTTSATLLIQGKGANISAAPTNVPDWRLGSFYRTNYPAFVTIFQDRLTFANTPRQPNGVFFGTSEGYTSTTGSFSPSTITGNAISAAEGFSRTLTGDGGGSVITWLLPEEDLLIGSTARVWRIKSNSGAESFGPATAVSVTASTLALEQGVAPVVTDKNALVVEQGGRGAFRLITDELSSELKASDITFFSRHLFNDDTIDGTFQIRHPYDYYFTRMASGAVYSILYNPSRDGSQEIVGMVRHRLGGRRSTNWPLIRSTCNVYNSTTGLDELWLVVERTVNGNTRLFIEYFDGTCSLTTDDIIQFCDAQKSTSFTGTSVTGLTEYAGETVAVCIDGGYAGTFAVTSGGALTLPLEPQTSCIVGFPYTSVAWLLPPFEDEKSPLGNMFGTSLHSAGVDVTVYNSLDLVLCSADISQPGTAEVERARAPVISASDDPAARPTYLNRTISLSAKGDASKPTAVYALRTDTSYPLNILAVRVNATSREKI